MKKSLLPQIEQKEREQAEWVFPDDMLDDLDSEYANSLPNYKLKKRYMELFLQKVMRPDPIYIWVSQILKVDLNSHQNKEVRKVYDCESYDEARLRKSLKHIRCGDKSFVHKW